MTMVEDKETKFKSMGAPSSGHVTLVPIKKRRFPIIWPPSPPPEEPCPIPEPNEKQRESTSVSQGSSILSIAPDEAKGSAITNIAPDEAKGSLILNVTPEEGKGSASLNITPEEGKVAPVSDITPDEVKPESTAISSGAVASSALQRSEDASANQDKLEPLSVHLALTNGESNFDNSVGPMKSEKSESDVTDPCTDRSNWDLNTTMDNWEGSGGDDTSINTDHLHGTIAPSEDRADTKPLGSPTKMAEVKTLGEHTPTEQRLSEVGAASSAPCAVPQTHEDSLKLGLQTPFPSRSSQETPYLSPGINPNRIFSRVSSAGSSSTSTVPPVAVKSEPLEEAQKRACLGIGSGDLRSLTKAVVKRETVDKGGLEISSKTLKLFSSRSVAVKAEPAYEGVPVTLSMTEGTSKRLEQISQRMILESSSAVTESLPLNCPVVSESQIISNRLEDSCRNMVNNDYEDGEVQDQIAADGPAGPVNATSVENLSTAEGEPQNMELAGNPSYQCADIPLDEKEDVEMQICSGMEETLQDDKSQISVGFDTHLQDLSDVEVDSDTSRPAAVTEGTIVAPADGNPMIHPETARTCGEATVGDHELDGALAQDVNAMETENNASNDDAEKNGSTLPNNESSVNSDVLGRDSNTESNRSRIINLSATFNMSSPGKTSSGSDRPFHDGRKRLPNVPLEGDKLHLRGRDEVDDADFHRFSRERSRDMFSRNRSGFARDRGRMCSDWDSEQDFGSEMHNGPMEFRPNRYRYNSEYRNYNATPDDGFAGNGRGGRKLFNENSQNFHNPHSIRRGHGGRDGPGTRGLPMMGRMMRNMSPSRCISMDDSDMAGVRHGFVRRERNIGSFGTKGLNRIHSKSPVRLRSRSPLQWSSPRRRSPDGFVRHPEMAPRRSSPMYRRDRMGSPDRACFRGEVMMRRQNSPPYLSRQLDDMREMNTGRDHGFSRPVMHNGNSSNRASLRTRRYDMVNSRERTHGEYFRVPMRGGRFHELSGDENTDERRRLNEKRGPVRHFRPAGGSDNKSFNYTSDEGSRSYRICPEDDSVYHEGSNSRERQLERHPKNDSGDAHKTRKIEDQEGSFRPGVSDEFDDMPRFKRERF